LSKMKIVAQRNTWETPMANKVTHVAVAMRETMEAMDWEFLREKSERMYTRFSVILPFPKVAYVFRFRVTDPLDDVKFDTWEMRMTHRGDISFMSIDNYTFEDTSVIKDLLHDLVDRLPRRPWDFPFGQRMEAGYALPEWNKAKQMWKKMDFDVSKKTPRDWIPKGSIGDRMRDEMGLDYSDDDLDPKE
jgi:hypothetical protein